MNVTEKLITKLSTIVATIGPVEAPIRRAIT
jgi:hypothetical protein